MGSSDIGTFMQTLRQAVASKFAQARANKDLIFSDTELSILRSQTLHAAIQLRYCPALKTKPTKDSLPQKSNKKPDPFEDPVPELLIARTDAHNLVLNKYPVIENHFIAATVTNKLQTDLLEEDDLSVTHECLRAWSNDAVSGSQHALFAFFNSGEHSGASQSHRHLQFLPIEDMATSEDREWQLLCQDMRQRAHDTLPLLHNPLLPFVHFATSLEAGMSSYTIHDRYLLLVKAALASISEGVNVVDIDAISLGSDKRTALSYNLCMTSDLMAILPRRAEAAVIPGTSDGHVFVNGTILAGTLMVRSEDDWNQLREKPELVQQILKEITYPITRQTRM